MPPLSTRDKILKKDFSRGYCLLSAYLQFGVMKNCSFVRNKHEWPSYIWCASHHPNVGLATQMKGDSFGQNSWRHPSNPLNRIWDAIPYIQGFRDLLLISSDCLTVLLPSLFIILYFSLLSCLAPSKRGRARMERKRTTMGEAAQIRCKSALPPPVYIPPFAMLLMK